MTKPTQSEEKWENRTGLRWWHWGGLFCLLCFSALAEIHPPPPPPAGFSVPTNQPSPPIKRVTNDWILTWWYPANTNAHFRVFQSTNALTWDEIDDVMEHYYQLALPNSGAFFFKVQVTTDIPLP